MAPEDVLAPRAALWRQGFRPVAVCNHDAPGPSPGKRPVGNGWQERARRDPPEAAAVPPSADALNTGILCDGLRALDVDCDDARIVAAIRAAAERRFGVPLTRTRANSPRVLLLYRAAATSGPAPGKRSLQGARGTVEALGRGQQFVAFGRHHSGAVLEWQPVGPDRLPVHALPEIAEDLLTIFLAEDVAPLIGADPAQAAPPAPRERAENASVPLVNLDTPAALDRARAVIAATPGAERGQQSDATFRLAARVKDEGVSEIVCAALMMEWAGRCAPPIGAADLEYRVGNAYRYGQNRPGAKAPEALFDGVNIPPPPEIPPPPPAVPAEARRSKLRMLSVEECSEAPPRGYVVKGLLAPGQVGCIFGQPGAGKSVLAPHLAYRVAQGRPVFGHRTKQGAVFYVAAEDEAGMRQRVNALRLRNGDAADLYLIAGVSALVAAGEAPTPDLAALLALAEERRPVLIVVDTLAAASSGLDENSSQDMSRIAKAMRSLARFGAAVLLVHQSPKAGDTPRGHGVLNGELDMSMIVARDETAEGVIRAELRKNRNGPCHLDIAFRIESCGLGRDEDGDAITAPVCLDRTADEVRADRRERLTKQEHKALDILCAMANGGRAPSADSFGPRPPVPIAEWEERCVEPGAVSDATRKTDRRVAFNKAKDALVAKRRIVIDPKAGIVTCLAADATKASDMSRLPGLFGKVVLPACDPGGGAGHGGSGAEPGAAPGHMIAQPMVGLHEPIRGLQDA
ncbi:MAG: AAA family ATPase [Acetobacteraceae bacterium]